MQKVLVKILMLMVLFFLFAFSEQTLLVENMVGKNINDIDMTNVVVNVVDSNEKAGVIVAQGVNPGERKKQNELIKIFVSNGFLDFERYRENKVNELGKIPVLMYHGIYDMKNEETDFSGGNVDRHGYHRTTEAFRSDLEFFYQNDYYMISLRDYLMGTINVPIGKSPVVLTFDDGLANNIRVLGRDDDNQLIIDENSAVGIMEEFRAKYDDFGVTATFFLNQPLFRQREYNYDIIKWLIDNNYDVGNHGFNHKNLSPLDKDEVQMEIGRMDALLKEISDNRHLNVVALPYGRPYQKTHENFSYILKGRYQEHNYENIAVLRSGWKPDFSPFDNRFDQSFIKRVQAYDKDGENFDIETTFARLEETRYRSSGIMEIVVAPENMAQYIATEKRVILYD